MTARSFIVATSNAHKLQEIRAILANFPFDILPLLAGIDFPDETGTTYEENALQKAVYAARLLGKVVLADDSGLEIENLPNQLGIRSSRFLGEETGYAVKNARILELLKDVPEEKRLAKFVCAAAGAFPDGKSLAARGEVKGRIALEIKGSQGFGYDPIFFLPEYGKTMAELPPEEKNKISHRAQAFRALAEQLTRVFGKCCDLEQSSNDSP